MTRIGGGQEEVGWRAYAMEPLEARFGLWGGSVVLGLVWALWHLPLWFVADSSQEHVPVVAFATGTVGLSYFFPRVMKASGGRWSSLWACCSCCASPGGRARRATARSRAE